MTAKREAPESTAPMLATEPIDSTEAAEPMLPIDRTDPTEPIDSSEFTEPMLSIELRDR